MFQYALDLAGKSQPVVGFIPTASGDSPEFVDKFYSMFRALECRPTHLPLFARTPNVASFFDGLDVVLVGGGNTLSMLGAWQPWGVADQLRRAWNRGVVLSGWSAGAICWFESGFSDAHAERFTPIQGLGILPGSCCPHFDQGVERREAFMNAVTHRVAVPGWGIDGGAALHFEDTAPRTLLKKAGASGARFVSVDGEGAPPTPAEHLLPGD